MSKKKEDIGASDFKNFHVPDIKVDLLDLNNYSNRILPEREFRRKILTRARTLGCEKEMLLCFNKYDNLLRNCASEAERKDIAKLANVEVYRLLGGKGPLVVDGQLIFEGN